MGILYSYIEIHPKRENVKRPHGLRGGARTRPALLASGRTGENVHFVIQALTSVHLCSAPPYLSFRLAEKKDRAAPGVRKKRRCPGHRWQTAVRTIVATFLRLASLRCFSVRCRYGVQLGDCASLVQAARQMPCCRVGAVHERPELVISRFRGWRAIHESPLRGYHRSAP